MSPEPTRRPPVALLAVAAVIVLAMGWLGTRVFRGAPLPALPPGLADAPLPSPGDPIVEPWAAAGRAIFERRCLACHGVQGEPRSGPDLAGVATRRDPAWLRAMILAPDSMLRDDPIARALLERYRLPMPPTGLDEAGARAVLEYLRSVPVRE